MEETRIVLVRHGESLAQERQIVGGHAGCTGLSERGREQSIALRDRLFATGELIGASAFYTSLMARAAETAEIIAGAVGHHEAVSDCDFCEHHPGEADGISWAEADRLYPPAAYWEPDGRRVPGAETWREMSLRVARGLDTVAHHHRGGTVVIVCHGGVIVHSLIRWLGLEPNARAGGRGRLDPVNTSITEWCLLGDRNSCGAQDVRLERFNDHAHLSGSRDGTGERRAPVPDRRP